MPCTLVLVPSKTSCLPIEVLLEKNFSAISSLGPINHAPHLLLERVPFSHLLAAQSGIRSTLHVPMRLATAWIHVIMMACCRCFVDYSEASCTNLKQSLDPGPSARFKHTVSVVHKGTCSVHSVPLWAQSELEKDSAVSSNMWAGCA